jgi:hypothetical protein
MNKFGTIVAAIVAAGIALPSVASAATVIVRHGDRDRMSARAEYRDHDRGWHRGWHHHHDRVVIIRHGHRY